MPLYSEVNWKAYFTHFLYCPAQLSGLDFTVLFRTLRCLTLSLLCRYEPKRRDACSNYLFVKIKLLKYVIKDLKLKEN